MNIDKQGLARNLLILVALTGTVLLGWLAGHILRYSIPSLWHPPIQEMNPHIENGYEFEFEGEPLAIAPLENLRVRVYIGGEPAILPERCVGHTYYTSLPVKCRSANGELVRVEESLWKIIPGR